MKRDEDKVVINLPRPMPASNDCLPHAAMNLGAPRGVGLKPIAGGMVIAGPLSARLAEFVDLGGVDVRGGGCAVESEGGDGGDGNA